MTTPNSTPAPVAAPAAPAAEPAPSPIAAALYPADAPAPVPAEPAAPAPAAVEPAAAPVADPAAAPPADPDNPAEPAPVDLATRYPIEFPEGFTPNDTQLGAFRELAAEANLDPAVVQKFFGLYAEQLTALQTEAQANVQQQQTAWRDEVLAFPEFQPATRERTQTQVSRVMEEFGTPEGRQWLDVSGVGNNPHLVRLVLNLTNALLEGEATPVGSVTPSPGRKQSGPKTLGSALYD